jgi:hypothetical protein
VDRPAIYWVVEEDVAAGATDILLITGREKRAIPAAYPDLHLREPIPSPPSWARTSRTPSMATAET